MNFAATVLGYTVESRLPADDLADRYRLTYSGGGAVLRVARHPGDSDLLLAESAALTRLDRAGEPRHRGYAARLIETFHYEDPVSRARRAANVLADHAGFVPLTRVGTAYPDGVDPRDAAWMWRRLLVALGYAHRAGVVHGAVLPDAVLIHPDQHGLVLADWCYAVPPGGRVPALRARYRDWYPPEVAARAPATEATDIYLATACMRWLMGPRAHPALLRFAQGCALPSPRMRPHDAWRLLAELDELLEDLYGPRQFRPFALR